MTDRLSAHQLLRWLYSVQVYGMLLRHWLVSCLISVATSKFIWLKLRLFYTLMPQSLSEIFIGKSPSQTGFELSSSFRRNCGILIDLSSIIYIVISIDVDVDYICLLLFLFACHQNRVHKCAHVFKTEQFTLLKTNSKSYTSFSKNPF